MVSQISAATRADDVESVVESRLLPRVTFRSLLLLTAVSAIAIAVTYAAEQGGIYAAGATIGLGFLLTIAVVSALLFLLCWSVSLLPRMSGVFLIGLGVVMLLAGLIGIPLGTLSFLTEPIALLNFELIGFFLLWAPIGSPTEPKGENPFAEGQLPPQILAPREPVE
ncbi:hypothetical protein FYK55_11850 [Roseiconus nitratireducens]|uniref:Uncharacterized protein n=1 Tax=Roseiconus nitratireducens TaxID=2605748 RepID=A0A5M6DBH6_9BACT|nr:hypothetical protein [Roseiconus nitratireducens]KAA5543856.1 hypothetical protein FYK55_11850 [Roseiconus nitratireducens]